MPRNKSTIRKMLALSAIALVPTSVLADGYDYTGVEADPGLAARVSADIRAAGVLVAGSDNAFAPWEYLAGDDGQTPEGIDIDLASAMAAKLGLSYESRTAQFSSILPALGTNYDIGVSAMSITNERMQTVNFVNYVEAGSEWAVAAGNPRGFDPADICGDVIAVQTGSWYEGIVKEESEACVARGKDALNILPFSVQTEAMTRVAAGGADAAIAGGATVFYAAKQSGGAVEAMRPVGTLGGTGLVGIAVPKDDLELTQLISDTMNALMDDGTYGAILDHWGVASMAVPAAVINPKVDR
ncbi:transporter substrate-binding domain-containing protein [Shimia sp.]|uniref:transporter substrate-binding domain-containing protein n=1 Tax=Shimia sp. TaxID=1954381 RepID=UPI003B8DAB56